MRNAVNTLFSLILLSGCVSVTDNSRERRSDPIQIADSRIALGLAYFEQGLWERTRQNLESAVQVAPNYYRSHLTLAFYLQEVGEPEQAENAYQRAISYATRNGDVYNDYGVFLCRQNRFEESQAAFAKAIAQPHYYKIASSYENAALCALKDNDLENAKNWFQKAIDHEPNRPISSIQLATLELQEGALERVRSRMSRFHRQYDYTPASLLILIELERRANRMQEMQEYAGLLAKKFPQN